MRYLMMILTMACLSLRGEIVEIQHLKAVREHVTPGTLLVLDLDNTLMQPVTSIGSEQWFNHRLGQKKQEHDDHSKAFLEALDEFRGIQYFQPMVLSEEDAADIVRGFQKQGFEIVGLTSRGIELFQRTAKQLKELAIDLSCTMPRKTDLYFNPNRPVLYHEGIIYTDGQHKGEMLRQFLQFAGIKPKRILFVDDKRRHVENVVSTFEAMGVPCVGLRYGHLDQVVADFDPKLSDLAWERFKGALGHL